MQVKPRQLWLDIKRTLTVAMPLIVAQLLQMANGLVDALVAGRLGTVELAAGGIGAGLWFFASIMCIGLMAGLSPTLSRLIGQSRRKLVGSVYRQGLWLGLAVGLLALLFLLLMAGSLDHWSIQKELVPFIRQYIYSACWSLPAFAVVMASRNVCEATGLTRPVMLVQLIGWLVWTAKTRIGWYRYRYIAGNGVHGSGVDTYSAASSIRSIPVIRAVRLAAMEYDQNSVGSVDSYLFCAVV